MTDSSIRPGDFVRYTHLSRPGIGKVKDDGSSPLVEFWDGKKERKDASSLTLVADGGSVALLWDGPEGLAQWAREKPLKLTAMALSIDGGKGSPNSIKEMLDGRVPLSADWKGWWGKRAKSLNALSALPKPEHFTRSAKGNVYTLLCDVAETPDDVSAPATLSDWKQWLLRDMKLPTFGKNPSEVLCDSLAEWPEDTIEQALKRVLWGAELLLDSPSKPSAAATLAWMDAVGSAVLRWRECALQSDGLELAQRSGDMLARLAQHIRIKEKRRESTLFQAGMLSEAPDRERQLEQLNQIHAAELARSREEWGRQQQAHAAALTQAQEEQERLQQVHAAELARSREERERKQQTCAAALAQAQEEQERLRQQVRIFRTQMASGREESRFEIRQGMLLAVGDALQRAYLQGKSYEDRLGNVLTTLPNVLREGGASPLGKVGDTVAYDPELHHSLEAIPSGAKVRLAAPGVVVGEQVILKANVLTETEVC